MPADDPRAPLRLDLRDLARILRRWAVDCDTIARADYRTPAGFVLATRAVCRLYSRQMQRRIDQMQADSGIDVTREPTEAA